MELERHPLRRFASRRLTREANSFVPLVSRQAALARAARRRTLLALKRETAEHAEVSCALPARFSFSHSSCSSGVCPSVGTGIARSVRQLGVAEDLAQSARHRRARSGEELIIQIADQGAFRMQEHGVNGGKHAPETTPCAAPARLKASPPKIFQP